MTAVEWCTKQILEYKNPTNINGTDYILIPVDKIEFLQEQAKEMEKEQIKDSYCDGRLSVINKQIISAEKYYNQTFKSE